MTKQKRGRETATQMSEPMQGLRPKHCHDWWAWRCNFL